MWIIVVSRWTAYRCSCLPEAALHAEHVSAMVALRWRSRAGWGRSEATPGWRSRAVSKASDTESCFLLGHESKHILFAWHATAAGSPGFRLARLSPHASVCGAAAEGGPRWLPQVIDDLRAAAAANPGMRLQLVGHSMGAGCAAILAMMCARPPQTRIFMFWPTILASRLCFDRCDVLWTMQKIQCYSHAMNISI